MNDNLQAQKSSASVLKNRLIAAMLFFIPAFVVIGGFLLGPQVLKQYDLQNVTNINCIVTSVESQIASTTSRTGLGGSSAQVLIRTSSCGDLLLSDGVTKENSEEIAKQFVINSTYRFEVGSGSQKLRGLLDILGVTPEIINYQEL